MFITDHIILVLLWVLFGVLHSMLAAGWCKRFMQRVLGRKYKYYHIIYSLFAAITLMGILVFQFTMPSRLLFTLPGWAKVLFWLPALIGLAIMLIVIRKYFFSLSGICVFYKQQLLPVLKQDGLHRYVRHPLYFGTLLFLWSLFLLFPYLSNGLACIVITLYTLLGARLEEKKLIALFGEKYVAYKQRIPMIFPRFILPPD
ncbi:isoprenylcysteine carboxylmethyltransferase family protein [Niastella caeni]|uniref:Isoprenylcysteine carboxylmethyltransferase family protein n=1 Tax=Niastella caeni TaxID=2569763 RepID=A0A4S8HWT9_9BACT|nr:isoprenylcysteine carboxylmethyltransferase family protein [Niastella caeni]THU40100.1 isoprenylcysteine carboxylmethyltransferase family protein [Niastella caeni]